MLVMILLVGVISEGNAQALEDFSINTTDIFDFIRSVNIVGKRANLEDPSISNNGSVITGRNIKNKPPAVKGDSKENSHISSKPTSKKDKNGESKNNDEIFSYPTTYDYVNNEAADKMCPGLEPCQASIKERLVCGSDGLMYQNIGVLACVQRCKLDLELKEFRPCDNATPKPLPTPRNVRTTSNQPPKKIYDGLRKEAVMDMVKEIARRRYERLLQWNRPEPPVYDYPELGEIKDRI